jgi:hypothetical protein
MFILDGRAGVTRKGAELVFCVNSQAIWACDVDVDDMKEPPPFDAHIQLIVWVFECRIQNVSGRL